MKKLIVKEIDILPLFIRLEGSNYIPYLLYGIFWRLYGGYVVYVQ